MMNASPQSAAPQTSAASQQQRSLPITNQPSTSPTFVPNATPTTSAQLMQMQRVLGNRAVTQLLQRKLQQQSIQRQVGSTAASPSHSAPPHQQVVQRVDLTEEGRAYKESIKTPGTWGGFIEAQTVATHHQFISAIYVEQESGEEDSTLKKLTDIGQGDRSGLSLAWVNGNHYKVVDVDGTANEVDDWNVVHDPEGTGDCLYEALSFILRAKQATEPDVAALSTRFQTRPDARKQYIQSIRNTASDHIDNELANMAGQEEAKGYENEVGKQESLLIILSIYKEFPKEDWEIDFSGKDLKTTGRLIDRTNKSKKVPLYKEAKKYTSDDKSILHALEYLKSDLSYFSNSKKGNKELIAKLESEKRAAGEALFKQRWHHIKVGDINSDGRATGYHWYNPEGIHEKFGTATGTDSNGVYKSFIRNKKNKKLIKADASSFFPDDWVEADFRTFFTRLNSSREVSFTLENGRAIVGLKYLTIGDTIFPVYEGSDEPRQT